MGFFERLSLALKVLFSGRAAAELAGGAKALPDAAASAAPRLVDEDALRRQGEERGALMVIALFQREGRLLDFISEDVTSFSDADVGAAARAVHEGCKKSLAQLCALGPLRDEAEESTVTVPEGFDPATVRLSGNVTGQPPYTGTLVHAGWRAQSVTLPERDASVDATVLAPAEVEL